MKVQDLKPGMDQVDIRVEVVDLSQPKKVTMGNGVKRDILQITVKDETGSIALVLWDDKVIRGLKTGDNLRIRNGFVTSYRGEWRINLGKYGELERT